MYDVGNDKLIASKNPDSFSGIICIIIIIIIIIIRVT
jgi:hypothetical protein